MASIQIRPPLLWIAGTLWPPVCLGIVLGRFAMRRSQRARHGPDDWIMIPALILIFGMAATILAGVAQHASGYPTPKPPKPGSELIATSPQQTVTRKAYMAITLLQTAALTFIKISCMLFYHRIFRTASSVANYLTYIIVGLILIWGVGYFFGFLFACETHFDYFWTNLENQLKCPADFNKINLSLSVSDVIMDFILLIFPVPWILRMQMSLGKKMLVLGIFTLGSLAVTASITRLVIIVEELNVVSTAGLYFMFNEAYLALITVCLPSLSGLRRTWAIQNLIDSFRSLFSNLSISSDDRVERRDNNSSNSKPGTSVPLEPMPSKGGVVPIEDVDLELQPLRKNDRHIAMVTSSIKSS